MLASSAFGQTLVDLRTQSKSIDFSALPSTKPVQVGTALPATCQVGQMFFNSGAAPGANLFGCTATNIWSLQSSGSGSSGNPSSSGATMAAQLGDLQVVRTSGSVLTIGANCSNATPCNVHFGGTVFSITSAATATVSGTATGMLFVYVSGAGVLTVGSNLSIACNSCSSQASITSFPADSVPVATWSVTNGAFDATGGQDFRAVLGTKNLIAGQGIVASDTNGNAVIGVDTTLIGLRVAVPASASSVCQAGAWSYDSNYFYICVAANTWKRSAISSW